MRRLLAIAALVLVPGCGGDGDGDGSPKAPAAVKHRAPSPAESRDIRATIGELEEAIADGDARAVCNLYPEDARQVQAEAYASCDTATRSDLEGEKPPSLAVGRIEISAARGQPGVLEASANVTSSARGRRAFDVDTVLVREGSSWRIDGGVLDYLLEPKSDSGSGGGEALGDE